METVTLTRAFDAPTATVSEQFEDVESFMLGAGFDAVDVDGDTFTIENGVGIATIELTLQVVDDPESAFAYEQVDGIFEEMLTTYAIAPLEDGCEVTARTEFALDVALVGGLMDATVIKRQRRKELNAQFDWLESAVSS
jgi:hypothetical protein